MTTLPQAARAKFEALAQIAADADALASSSLRLIAAKEDDRARLVIAFDSAGPDRFDEIKAMITVLDSEMVPLRRQQAIRYERVGQANRTLGSVKQFLSTLPAAFILEMEEHPGFKPRDGESLPHALSRIRNEIAALQRELASVGIAPLPPAELKKYARAQVAELAKAGRPLISSSGGKGTIEFRGHQPAYAPGMSAGEVAAILAWFDPEAMVARLEEEIDRLPQEAQALSASEVEQRKRSLPAQILKLERDEEKIVEALIATGQDVALRADADARALLDVRVVKRASVAARMNEVVAAISSERPHSLRV